MYIDCNLGHFYLNSRAHGPWQYSAVSFTSLNLIWLKRRSLLYHLNYLAYWIYVIIIVWLCSYLCHIRPNLYKKKSLKIYHSKRLCIIISRITPVIMFRIISLSPSSTRLWKVQFSNYIISIKGTSYAYVSLHARICYAPHLHFTFLCVIYSTLHICVTVNAFLSL